MSPQYILSRMASREGRELVPLSETPHSLYDFLQDTRDGSTLWVVLEHANMEIKPTQGDGMIDVTCRRSPDSFEWRRIKDVEDVEELILEMCDDPVIGRL